MKAKQERFFVALYSGSNEPLAVTGGLRPRRKAIGVLYGEFDFPADVVCVAFGHTMQEALAALAEGDPGEGWQRYRAW